MQEAQHVCRIGFKWDETVEFQIDNWEKLKKKIKNIEEELEHLKSKKIEDYIGNYFNDLIREKLFVYVTNTDSTERLFDLVNGFPLLHFSPEILQDRNLTARLDYLTLNRHSLIEIQAGILNRTLELDSLVRIEIGKN